MYFLSDQAYLHFFLNLFSWLIKKTLQIVSFYVAISRSSPYFICLIGQLIKSTMYTFHWLFREEKSCCRLLFNLALNSFSYRITDECMDTRI